MKKLFYILPLFLILAVLYLTAYKMNLGGDIPQFLLLKAPKENILASEIDGDIVKYIYKSEYRVEDKPNEIISKRTDNTRYFETKEKDKVSLEISVGFPYYKDKNSNWYYRRYATTTKEAFNEQMKVGWLERLLGEKAVAIDEQVGVSTDDAGTLDGTWSLNEWWISFGFDWSEADKSGFRFQTVDIANGSTIDVAYFTIQSTGNGSGSSVNLKIYCEDTDDSTTFSTEANYDARAVTPVAGIDWDISDSFPYPGPYTSPSIVTAVQNVVNRGSWVANNDLSVLVKDDGTTEGYVRFCISYDQVASEGGTPPVLHIEYTPAGGEEPPKKSTPPPPIFFE